MSKRKVRPLGQILFDLEDVLLEMVDHDLQWGDILGLVYGYLMVHAPDAREEYTDQGVDGKHPEYYYGPRRGK